jgi:hypothetical protein
MASRPGGTPGSLAQLKAATERHAAFDAFVADLKKAGKL